MSRGSRIHLIKALGIVDAGYAREWEGGMGIVHAIEYRPAPPLDEPWARATLTALAAPRARA